MTVGSHHRKATRTGWRNTAGWPWAGPRPALVTGVCRPGGAKRRAGYIRVWCGDSLTVTVSPSRISRRISRSAALRVSGSSRSTNRTPSR